MNLLTDRWIPIVRLDGSLEKIAPWQIAELQNPVVEITAPRPDFQGALYQFLIGLLQTTFTPEDPEEWFTYWRAPPDVDVLASEFSKFVTAFEMINPDGPAFLQDFSMQGERKGISAILVNAPGEKTLKDNLDLFIKGGNIESACTSCASMALFTLQTNAPSGGAGHRVGLRGGGPLTSLLLPDSSQSALWQKLWLNVLSEEELSSKATKPKADIFPWLAETRTSGKTGCKTQPSDADPLQMYWGMPRRIRFDPVMTRGHCDLCGEESLALHRHFRMKNYGINYEGPWVHPLSAYKFDLKKVKPPLSVKGQQGGLGYRHWLGLIWADPVNGDKAAMNIQSYHNEKSELLDGTVHVSLWSFGYDMDNMKARCWYEQKMPVLTVKDKYREVFFQLVANLLNAAKDTVRELRTQVKGAWFRRPKEVKGDTSMVDQSFWAATEPKFYELLQILVKQPKSTRFMPEQVAKTWYSTLRTQALALFDYWVLEGEAEDLNMKRITTARRYLNINLEKNKSMKNLKQIATQTT